MNATPRSAAVGLAANAALTCARACATAQALRLVPYVRRLVSQGAQLRAFPKDVLDASHKEAFKLYNESIPLYAPISGYFNTAQTNWVLKGKSLTDKEIDSINWYVEGVEGKVPGK